jgi:PAS domain S-box-containing protein
VDCPKSAQARADAFDVMNSPETAELVLDDGLLLVDLLHEAVLELDADSRVTRVNRGAVELYGRPAGELLGQVVHDVLRTDFPTSREQVEDALATTGHWSGELVHHRPDGTQVVVNSRQAARRENGRVVGVVEVDQDITAHKAAQDMLVASEKGMRQILDSVEDFAIYLLDPAGRIASWSASARRLSGHADEDVLGLPWSGLFTPDPDVATGFDDMITRARHLPLRVSGDIARKDGRITCALGILAPMHLPDGSLRGFAAVMHDDTERRHAEAKFRGLLDSAPDAMIGVNPDGSIVFANLQAEALFGYSRDELLGQQMEMLLPERVRERHVQHRELFAAQPKTRPMGAGLELSARHRDGSEFPVEISLSTLETQESRIVSAAIRDISDRKRAQREIEALNVELRQANDELESRVAERTAALATQTATLKATNDELEAFSYSVSHDLRAPLRAIDGFAKLLAARYSSELSEEGQRYLEKVRTGAKQMGQLIDGLLAFSRLQRQALVRAPVDLAALVRNVWEEFTPDWAGRDIEFVVEDLPRANADARLIRHVLSNLLSNSIKYTRTRTPARITIGAEQPAGAEPVYVISDNGVGFDMRYADKLFQVFQRMHRAEEFEGTGIGLALVARIIDRHGGRVWANAEPDGGATFYFTLGQSTSDA